MKQQKRDDSITLAGVKIHPRIGVTPQERSSLQECEADLTVWDNFEGAASRDSLESSVDYSRMLSAVREVAATGEYSLIETLAYKIVRHILEYFPVSRARVRIRKRSVTLRDQMDYVEVEVEES